MKIEDEIKQTKFVSPHQKAVLNLLFTASWLQARHQQFFKSFGITTQQFNILRILKGQHPKSLSAKEIKSRMLDQNSDVSRILSRMVAKKLIQKQTCPADKRAADIFITEQGIELLSRVNKYQQNLDTTLQLSESEATTLSNLLDKSRG
ncbi:MAG: MarR family transcriptional regulator [Cyclobacteriaceae bacterium]|nr:MarR family transcriptional regulator [Cyclobacteriaceae bacterium]